jgi:ATP-dependent protease ClpP protease subunit
MSRHYNEENQEQPGVNQKKLLTKVFLQKTFHHIWLNSEIESADKYVDIFDCLMQATEGDVVAVHINSPGGDLDTALQIIDALESTPATTIAFLEGQACSAGSMIAMACENVEVSEYAYMMIHTFNQGISGKFSDIQNSTDFHRKWWKEVFEKLYADFCTPEEIESVLAGHELWLDADEIVERFNHRKQVREEESSKEKNKKQTQINKIVELMKKNDVNLGELAAAMKQRMM